MMTPFAFEPGHLSYLIPATGAVLVNGPRGDACENLIIQDESLLEIEAVTAAELVLVVTA